MWNTVSENPQVKEDIQVELRVHLETEDDVMMMLSRKNRNRKQPNKPSTNTTQARPAECHYCPLGEQERKCQRLKVFLHFH